VIEFAEGFRVKAGPALRRDVGVLLGVAAMVTRCNAA
jgi:hypothetical protein